MKAARDRKPYRTTTEDTRSSPMLVMIKSCAYDRTISPLRLFSYLKDYDNGNPVKST